MRMHFGCRFSFSLPAPTPMILLLNVHYSRASDLERPDLLVVDPAIPIEAFRDSFGNWGNRILAPAGSVTVSTDGIIRDSGTPDPINEDALQIPVEQ